MTKSEYQETIEGLQMELEDLDHFTRALIARNKRLEQEVERLGKLILCRSDDPEDMCSTCQCWKYTRKCCS